MDWTTIAVALISALAGGGFAALLTIRATNKKILSESGRTDAEAIKTLAESQKIKVEADATVADVAFQVLQKTLDFTIPALEKRINDQYETAEAQADKIEELNGKLLEVEKLVRKMGFMITILQNQLFRAKMTPLVTLDKIDSYSLRELKEMAEA